MLGLSPWIHCFPRFLCLSLPSLLPPFLWRVYFGSYTVKCCLLQWVHERKTGKKPANEHEKKTSLGMLPVRGP